MKFRPNFECHTFSHCWEIWKIARKETKHREKTKCKITTTYWAKWQCGIRTAFLNTCACVFLLRQKRKRKNGRKKRHTHTFRRTCDRPVYLSVLNVVTGVVLFLFTIRYQYWPLGCSHSHSLLHRSILNLFFSAHSLSNHRLRLSRVFTPHSSVHCVRHFALLSSFARSLAHSLSLTSFPSA